MTGNEILLFDPRRNPRDWIDSLGPTQCAVFLKDRVSSAALLLNGQPCRSAGATCVVFDTLDAAEAFCEAKVREMPRVRCEIYDSAGLAHPALRVIVHPDHQKLDDTGFFWSRRRKLIAVVLFLAAGPLIWIDLRKANTLILPTFLAFNCILTGLRFLFWDFGVKHREQERRKRLETHRRRERGSQAEGKDSRPRLTPRVLLTYDPPPDNPPVSGTDTERAPHG